MREHTSSELNITYNLMVSCPRIVWYILLASVIGNKMPIADTSRIIRRISAFAAGAMWPLWKESIVSSRVRA